MSTQPIPYPSDFDQDQLATHHEERRRLALAKVHPEDVLALATDALHEAPLAGHVLEPMILFVLDRAWAPGDGSLLWDRLRSVVTAAVEQALEEVLADDSAWEG